MENSFKQRATRKIILLCIIGLLCSFQLVQASDYTPSLEELSCQICIERFEEQGVINIRETRVTIDDKQALLLIGGQAACVFVSPGDHFIYAESYDPYDPASKNRKAWLSNKVQIFLKNNDKAELVLKKADDTKFNQWQIDEVKLSQKKSVPP